MPMIQRYLGSIVQEDARNLSNQIFFICPAEKWLFSCHLAKIQQWSAAVSSFKSKGVLSNKNMPKGIYYYRKKYYHK